jgi:hypothetical protein
MAGNINENRNEKDIEIMTRVVVAAMMMLARTTQLDKVMQTTNMAKEQRQMLCQ